MSRSQPVRSLTPWGSSVAIGAWVCAEVAEPLTLGGWLMQPASTRTLVSIDRSVRLPERSRLHALILVLTAIMAVRPMDGASNMVRQVDRALFLNFSVACLTSPPD